MSSKPTGQGLENTPLYERVILGRKEADRLMKIKKEWDPDRGEELPEKVLDDIYTKFGLDDLTSEEITDIKLKDIELRLSSIVEQGKRMKFIGNEHNSQISKK